MSRIAIAGLVVAIGLAGPPAGRAADIRLAGNAAELSVASISERTVRIVLAPLETARKPRNMPFGKRFYLSRVRNTVLVCVTPDCQTG